MSLVVTAVSSAEQFYEDKLDRRHTQPAPTDDKICCWCGSTSDRHVIEGDNRRCKACGALEGVLDPISGGEKS